jgi:glycosyltransferase involved in cell wall biosynthesis
MVALTDYPADTRVRREAEALARRGDEVDVVCPATPALGDRRTIGGVTLRTVTRFEYSTDARGRDYIARYASFIPAALFAVLRLHLRRPYDVVQVHTMPDVLVFTALGPKLLGAGVVLDVHDLMPELYASKFGLAESHWTIRMLRALERRSIAFADRAISVHRPHLDALVRHGTPEDRFTILMNVPDPALFAARSVEPGSLPFRLVYHGMIGRRNGLEVAIRAVARARHDIPALELRIIGDGDDAERLQALIEELGLQDVVRLDRGLFPIDDLIPVIAGANVGIVPILDDPFTRFMLPVKLLEYVALGLPVIASRTETIRAYFDESMICFSTPGDPDDLAARIVELYRRPQERRRLAAAAESFNAEHGWDRERARYYELIDSLIATRASRRRGRRSSLAVTAGMEAPP